MAPVSILPGRLRLECEVLRNERDLCIALEDRIASCAGVKEATVNFRTGRILVRFDEQVVDRVRLTEQVEALLCAPAESVGRTPAVRTRTPRTQGVASGEVARHILLDLVAHVVLPGPLSLLVPAVSVFKR